MASQLSAFAPHATLPLALHTHPSLFEKKNDFFTLMKISNVNSEEKWNIVLKIFSICSN